MRNVFIRELVYCHKSFIEGKRFKHYHHEKKWISFLLIYSAQFIVFFFFFKGEMKRVPAENSE